MVRHSPFKKNLRGEAYGNTVKIYGKHSVFAALQNKARTHTKLVVSDRIDLQDLQIAKALNISVEIKPDRELDAIASHGVHQGMILYTSSIFSSNIASINHIVSKSQSCVIILDQVSDPQNIGAIIRSGLAFDVDAIIIPEHNAPHETPALAKASAGAIEKIPIIKVANLVQAIKHLKENNYWVIGLDSNTDRSIKDIDFTKKTVFVLGSEGNGLRRLTKESCDFIMKLPMSEKIDSINVSNAAAIAMYEYFTSLPSRS